MELVRGLGLAPRLGCEGRKTARGNRYDLRMVIPPPRCEQEREIIVSPPEARFLMGDRYEPGSRASEGK